MKTLPRCLLLQILDLSVFRRYGGWPLTSSRNTQIRQPVSQKRYNDTRGDPEYDHRNKVMQAFSLAHWRTSQAG